MSSEFRKVCSEKGITVQYTPSYTPQHKGVTERYNQTVLNCARSLIFERKLDKKLSSEAILTAAYFRNRSPTQALEGKAPFEMSFKRKPDVNNLRIFDCDAFVEVPDELRQKMDRKTKKGKMIGYSEIGCRIWLEKEKKIKCFRNMEFNENQNSKDSMVTVKLVLEKSE